MTEPCQQEGRIASIEAKVDVITDKIEEIRPDIMVIKDRWSLPSRQVRSTSEPCGEQLATWGFWHTSRRTP
jgi:hypothetical protein